MEVGDPRIQNGGVGNKKKATQCSTHTCLKKCFVIQIEKSTIKEIDILFKSIQRKCHAFFVSNNPMTIDDSHDKIDLTQIKNRGDYFNFKGSVKTGLLTPISKIM